MEVLNIYDIMEILPHRYPFLLIDRVTDILPGKSAVGYKNITVNEPCFQGHFPTYPIFPGVLTIEAMAQTMGVLIISSFPDLKGKPIYFLSIDECKFRRPIIPGDQVRFEVEVIKTRGKLCRAQGRAFVEGQLCAEAIICAQVHDV